MDNEHGAIFPQVDVELEAGPGARREATRRVLPHIIPVTDGIGTGKTPLAAFDCALFRAGIGNHNLIHLSSVIPLGAVPRIGRVDRNGIEQGHKLYVVYAANQTATPGIEVAAGLGWIMADEAPGWGLFVEHAGATEADVRAQVEASLASMIAYRPGIAWGEVQCHTVSAICEGDPLAVLVAAVYESEPWRFSPAA